MKEFYYSDGKVQFGPYSLDQLKIEGLTRETLIWYEGLDDWQPLHSLPELSEQLRTGKVPPPLPAGNTIPKMEITGNVKVTSEKTPNAALESITPSRTTLLYLLAWCCFHMFALLMSYSQIDFFNASGEPSTDRFWPFVKFTDDYMDTRWYGEGDPRNGQMIHEFHGIFSEYDLSEFALYVVGMIAIFFLHKISVNPKSRTTENRTTRERILIQTNEGKAVELHVLNNRMAESLVFIEGQKAPDGTYYWKILENDSRGGLKKFVIQDGKVFEFYHVTTYDNYIVEESKRYRPSTGDKIYSGSSIPLPSGSYKIGRSQALVEVEEGAIKRIVK